MVPKSAELASVVVASLGTILTGELVLSLRKKPVKVVHNRIREGTFFENSFFLSMHYSIHNFKILSRTLQ